MTMLLWDEAHGPIGEIGTDLIESRWGSGKPVRGTLALKGASPLVSYLMECRSNPMWVTMTDEIADGRYRVWSNTLELDNGVWTSYVALRRHYP